MVTNGKTKTNNHNGKGNGNGIGHNKRLFIEKYPECGSVGATLKAIGIKSRRTFYNWCDADPHFKEFYYNELLPNRRDILVSEMYHIAKGDFKSNDVQVRALFGFLKATDHADTGPDRLEFNDRNKLDMTADIRSDVTTKGESINDGFAKLPAETVRDAINILTKAGVPITISQN